MWSATELAEPDVRKTKADSSRSIQIEQDWGQFVQYENQQYFKACSENSHN